MKMKKFIRQIFSVRNENMRYKYYKIVTILGVKIKFRNKTKELEYKLAELNKLRNLYVNGINKEKINYDIANFEGLGVLNCKRTPRLIVSLTSFPDRMYDLHYSIYSLLNQSLKPDEVILWLAKEQFESKKISNKVLDLKKNGLTIRWCDDIKSYKKLIPTLKQYPNDIIVTADDDIYYPSDWLENLYSEYEKYPNCISAHRCHKFDLNIPYSGWEKEISGVEPSYRNFFTGAGGVLYPPGCLYKDVSNKFLFSSLAPCGDDIWFWAMAIKKHTKINVCQNAFVNLVYTTPEREYSLYEEPTLCSKNCVTNYNDEQIKNILEYYPEIVEIIGEK